MCAWEADYLDQAVPGQSLAQPAASTCGCLDGFSAWRGLSYAGGKGEQSPQGEGGQKEHVPFAHCHKRHCLCPFLLVVRGVGINFPFCRSRMGCASVSTAWLGISGWEGIRKMEIRVPGML